MAASSSPKTLRPQLLTVDNANFSLVACAIFFADFQLIGIIKPIWLLMTSVLLCYLNYRRLPHIFGRTVVFFLFPAVAIASALWSLVPSVSFSLGVQLLVTIFLGVMAGALLDERRIVQAVVLSTGLYCLACLGSGIRGASATGSVIVGFSGSKDAMGLIAEGLVAAAIAGFFMKSQPKWFRLVCLIILPLGLYFALFVHAATSIVMTAGFLAIFCAILALTRVDPRMRVIIGSLLVFLVAVTWLLIPDKDALWQSVLDHFGKDKTLTGRTTLWQIGHDWIRESPAIGHGYRAFWVSAVGDAQQLLSLNGVKDGRTFHFHQTYIEVLVDLGYLGFSVLMITYLKFFQIGARAVIFTPSSEVALFIATLTLLIVRSTAETLYLPFSPFIVTLYAYMSRMMFSQAAKVAPRKIIAVKRLRASDV